MQSLYSSIVELYVKWWNEEFLAEQQIPTGEVKYDMSGAKSASHEERVKIKNQCQNIK